MFILNKRKMLDSVNYSNQYSFPKILERFAGIISIS